MKTYIYITVASLGMLITSCIKNNPHKETFKVDGSWKIERVNIIDYDSTGTISNTTTLNDVGFMMLIHESEIYYEGSYSFKINSQEFSDTSGILETIFQGNTWQVSNYAKIFHVSFSGNVSGLYTFSEIGSFTITELKRKKFGLRDIQVYPNGMLKRTEEWKMVRATH